MDMIMMPSPSKPAMKFTIGRCGGSWIVKTKAPVLPVPRDYEEDEKNAAEALLMLSAGGGGLFHISNNSSSTASPATKKPKLQPSPPPAKNFNSHTCNECGKTFASHQALGGHKTSHRPKPAVTEDIVSAKNSSCRPHKCTVCHEVFQTCQALGGHKRQYHIDGITAGVAAKCRRETSNSIGLEDTNDQVQPLRVSAREGFLPASSERGVSFQMQKQNRGKFWGLFLWISQKIGSELRIKAVLKGEIAVDLLA